MTPRARILAPARRTSPTTPSLVDGSFHEAPSRAELERYFFLDDADREAVQAKRRSHNRLGYTVQLTSVRFLGRFIPDPRQVPAEVAEYLAGQRTVPLPVQLQARSVLDLQTPSGS